MKNDFVQLLGRFCRNERGATAIEYALIAGGLSIVILGAVIATGNSVRDDLFTPVSNALPN